MATLVDFLCDLERLVQGYAKDGLALKVEKDPESSTVKIFGEKATPLARAKNGIGPVVELAGTAAEHHPYWGLLDNSAEIAAAVLEKWQGDLSESELDEIRWHIKELDHSAKRLAEGRGSG